MRPRRIRRGWTAPVAADILPRGRFNEAPANSPGMARRTMMRCAWRDLSFNEAPANSPGMARLRALAGRKGADASMRPRRIRRGWTSGTTTASGTSISFNEAPANSPGMDGVPVDPVGPDSGFNEAPANSPGMVSHESPSSGGGGSSFNEAPANSPGMARAAIGRRRRRPYRFNEAPANSPGMGVFNIGFARTELNRLQ